MISIDLALVFQIVNFLVLMVFLNLFLYKPVRKMLAERDREITEAHERTASVDREVQEKMALYEAKLRQTTAAASEEKSRAIKAAREEEGTIIGKAREEAANTVAAIQSRIAAEADEARGLLAEQARTISREISERVLGRSLQQ